MSRALTTRVESCFEPIDQPTIRRLNAIEHGGAEDPSFPRPMLRYIVDPQFIWAQPVELAVDHIVGGRDTVQAIDPHRAR